MHGGDKLDGASKGEFGGSGESGEDSVDEPIDVDANANKDVEDGEARGGNGDEAGVAVVDELVGGEGGGGVIIKATGAVCGVSEDEDVVEAESGGGKEDVGKGKSVHEEAIGELEGGAARGGGCEAVDGLVDLEVVVGGEDGSSGVDGGIGEDRLRYLRLHEALRSGSGLFPLRGVDRDIRVGVRVRKVGEGKRRRSGGGG